MYIYFEGFGVYFVFLIIIDVNGCVVFVFSWVVVGEDCFVFIIFFLFDNQLFVVFEVLIGGDVVSWVWDFGDGGISIEEVLVYDYMEFGVYEVILIIMIVDGCSFIIVEEVYLVELFCDCLFVWELVCVVFNGVIIIFFNLCYVVCEGFSEEDFLEDCEGDCLCIDEWDFVCVFIENGEIIIFGNFCEVGCFGYDEGDFVFCELDCVCLDVYVFVCVFDLVMGVIFSF